MTHHRRGLRRLLGDEAREEAVFRDYETAGLEARTVAMLRYVDKLTDAPARMSRGDVDTLREHGFDDGDVLAICEVAAYYAFANRIADGLGVALEERSPEQRAGD